MEFSEGERNFDDRKGCFIAGFVFYEDNITHELYVRRESGKDKPISFESAIVQMNYDRDSLLKARQVYYYNKPVKNYNDLSDIQSITFAIPTYNGMSTIIRTLNSVVENLKDISSSIRKEVIICTDHCTDQTTQIVKKFIDGIIVENTKIIQIENNGDKGKANVLNKIFSSSSGDIFCVVDDDVILGKNCLLNLIKGLIADKNIKCVFSARKRLPLQSHNPWKLFWYWVLGIKFDVNPYDRPSGIVRGQSVAMRRENFVHFPEVINEDQFMHYIYWPQTKEIVDSVVYFTYVSSLYDYYRRQMRLKLGSKQMRMYFTKERIYEYTCTNIRKINYKKIFRMPLRLKFPFMIYKFVTFFINKFVKIRLRYIDNYTWYRVKQD